MICTRIALYTALVASLLGCGGEEPAKDKKLAAETLVEIDLSRPLDEREPPMFGENRPSHFAALARVRKLLDDPLARGLFARLGSFAGRFADVDDWSQLFEAYRAQKKPVHCHFDELDNAGYALAAHCDRVSMTPAGMLTLVGVAAQAIHGRALLDQLGVRADIAQAGKYKGAAEPFTRDQLSDEQRASLDALLSDLDETFRAHLAKRASLSNTDLQPILDSGPYTAGPAREAKLVDAVSYDDEARMLAKRASSARLVHRTLHAEEPKPPTLREIVKAISGQRDREYKGRPHLALGYVSGEISDGASPGFTGAASDPFVRTLRRWGDDKEVRAVLLRIESPGGSALASDRMWHAVQRVAKRKPVVVSLGDLAASGGYYIASAGTVIVAAPGSIVGSIGVVGGKMVVSDLANRVGVHVTTLSRAQRAAFFSPFQPFSPGERASLEALLGSTYRLFLERVAAGRKRDVNAILPAAEGRVMGGRRAQSLGLVDEVGGLLRAHQVALDRAKLPANAPLETWPDIEDPFSALTTMFGARSGPTLLGALEAALPDQFSSGSGLVHGLLQTPQRPLAVLPFALSVR